MALFEQVGRLKGGSFLAKKAKLHPAGMEPFLATFAYNAKAGCVNAIRADGRTKVVAEALDDKAKIWRCKRQCTIMGGPGGKMLKVTMQSVTEAQDLFSRLAGCGTVWRLRGQTGHAPR